MAAENQVYLLPTRAKEGQAPVNYTIMASFVKGQSQDVKNKNKKEYFIVWTPNGAMQEGQTITWRYDDEECRNQDYSDLINKICLPLGVN